MSVGSLRIPVVVADVRVVAEDVKRFRLVARDGSPLPPFSGGSHVIVEMRDGATLRRNAYSISSSPFDTSAYEISVRRDESGRGGSRFLHDHVAPGTDLYIGYPVNLFAIDRRARKHLFIAGGIGITPFIPMMEELAGNKAPFELHYAARSRAQAAYAEELARRYGDRVRLYESTLAERLVVTDLLKAQAVGTHAYVCGPERLIEDVLATTRRLGWPAESVHCEHFVAPASGTPYDVYLKTSGKEIHVGAHESMLEAIEAAGVDAPFLCRGGACGQCETRVLECDGTIVHHDHYLSDADKAAMRKVMPCVSRFEGRRLVLDL